MPSFSIQPFQEALHTAKQKYADEALKGKKIIGYFCTYTPVELIHAAGFLPMRLMGESRSIVRADTLVPDFICPYLRRTLEDALKGEYAFLSGVVQGYTCDAACGLINIWKENIGGEIFHQLPLPYNDNLEARNFLKSGILEFTEKLNRIGGRFSESSLEKSLELYGEIRRTMLGFYRLEYENRLPVNSAEFLSVIKAGFVMAPEEYLSALKTLESAVVNAEVQSAKTGIPVLVSGSLIEDPKVLDMLEAAGGRVAADDLCTGIRHFLPADGKGDNSLEKLVDRYVNRFPCPSRSRAVDRAPYLMDLIRKSKSKGVIFFLQKFCTPHLADLPILGETLKKANIPSLVFEMEVTGAMEGQLRTRLESFFEMIGD